MKFTWDEPKRKSNLTKHGLDFNDAARIFDGPLVLFKDDRESDGEQRMIAMGLLGALVVVIVHVESDNTIRIISIRKADKNETNLYYQNLGTF